MWEEHQIQIIVSAIDEVSAKKIFTHFLLQKEKI